MCCSSCGRYWKVTISTQKQIRGCDAELQKRMAAVPGKLGAAPAGQLVRKAKPRGNQPRFDVAGELRRTLGVDLTTVDGIDVMTAQVLLSEVGPELSAFPSEDHFAAWLELAPRRDVSGGKVIRHVKPDGRNRLANALRMAAQSLSRSDSYLGARYRSLRGRLGGQRAVKAMARYLACLLYRLMTKGQAYLDRGLPTSKASDWSANEQYWKRGQLFMDSNSSHSRHNAPPANKFPERTTRNRLVFPSRGGKK